MILILISFPSEFEFLEKEQRDWLFMHSKCKFSIITKVVALKENNFRCFFLGVGMFVGDKKVCSGSKLLILLLIRTLS